MRLQDLRANIAFFQVDSFSDKNIFESSYQFKFPWVVRYNISENIWQQAYWIS